jgi:iron-sulfur cluster repair protein YtfE (RIC family)
MFHEAELEHDEVDQLIQQVTRAGSSELDRVTSLMREMKQKVQHHVQEEENEVLPLMERSCGYGRMEQLGDAFARAKHQEQVSGTASTSFTSSSTSKEELLEKTKDELYEEAK